MRSYIKWGEKEKAYLANKKPFRISLFEGYPEGCKLFSIKYLE